MNYLIQFILPLSLLLATFDPGGCQGQNVSDPKTPCGVPELLHLTGGWAHLFPPHALELHEEPNVARTYFECSDSTHPVEWGGDFDLTTKESFRFTRSFNQRRGDDSFSSAFIFLHDPPKVGTLSLLCRNSCGGQRNLEIKGGLYSIQVKVTKGAEEKDPKDSLLRERERVDDPEGCDLTLLISANGTRLLYKWVAKDNSTTLSKQITEASVETTEQGIFYRSLFRSLPLNTACTRRVEVEDCEDCEAVEPSGGGGGKVNAIAFYARTNRGHKYGYVGALTVRMPRIFYFDWEVDPKEMMEFSPEETYYVGENVSVNCSVSALYFSFGTRLTLSNVDLDPQGEFWTNGAKRIVNGRMKVGGRAPRIATLKCSAPLHNWGKWVEKTRRILIDVPLPPAVLLLRSDRNNGSAFQFRDLKNQNITIICEVRGKPAPSLQWISPHSNGTLQEVTQRGYKDPEDGSFILISELFIPAVTSHTLGTYRCVATNKFGLSSQTYVLSLKEGPRHSPGTLIAVTTALVVLFLGGCLSLALIHRRYRLKRREFWAKTKEAIKEFKEGVRPNENEPFKGPTHENGNTYSSYHTPILQLPYNDKFEVDREKWTLSEKFLGEGAFGFVRKGEVLIGGKVVQVAVKMLKSSVDVDDFKSFLTELKVMAWVGPHPNVVSLLAACTGDIEEGGAVMIGLEFCGNGNLLDYLQDKRNLFRGFNCIQREESEAVQRTYANLSNPVALTEIDLYTWAYQIASGMDFLSSKRVLHGDLAARNILLGADKTAKISDFGLSRILQSRGNYKKRSEGPLPWRWMALESLQDMTFSSKSDVWGFGVTLWEIFSLGAFPYPEVLVFGPEFVKKLEQGNRLDKPHLATDYLYVIMRLCWNPDPERRVNFPLLKAAFSELLEIIADPTNANSSVRNESHLRNIRTSLLHNHTHSTEDRATRLLDDWTPTTTATNLYLNV